ncbi:interleukin-6 receptor subunit beta-like isoform X2 [Betta splendens]|uniref:Interleukin-6 receptor subunit beta-like isoform X2 n=1 Tax=Betta splendens TaxID=158456 RepID=A0A6P7LUA8_BETSP|nr:interleukin-6 receptor subunit beta-like isoform X2 [Betta splendens]
MRPFVALVLLAALSSVCADRQANSCSVVPRDQYLEYGRDTEVVCRTSCLPGPVSWTLGDSPVAQSLSRSVNSTHAVLTLRNFTRGDAALECRNWHTGLVLGGTYIRTYHRPTNLSCVIHPGSPDERGVAQLLSCRWEHRDAPPSTNYTLLYARRSKPEDEAVCRSRATRCTCPNRLRVSVDAWLAVRAATEHWEAVSDRVVFKPHEITRISRPSVNVTASPDRVDVTWNQSMPSVTCHCQVRYAKTVNGEVLEPQVLNKTLEPRQAGVQTLEDLDSCSNYSVRVRCALDRAPWSDWSREHTLETGLSKRHVRLRLWRTISDPGANGSRKVRALWTEVPPSCRGSFTYALGKASYADADPTPVPCGRPPCVLDVDRRAHTLNLGVWENQRLLAEDSVYVPASAENLPQVTDVRTSSLNGAILVTWSAPAQPVSGYVVDWTHRGHRFDWTESGTTSAALSGLLDKKPYDITVTPLFDNKTGHGTQVLQICSRVGGPGNVTVTSVDPNDRTASVGWSTTSQEECSGDVMAYVVHYGAEKGPALNVTVDGTRRSIGLKELEPDTQYSVHVEAWALTGSTTSSRRLFRTKRYDSRLPLALGVCGSIVIALVFCVGLFCAVQWKKFSEKPVPNPGLSSLQLWSPAGQKEVGSLQPFITPSESLVDHIYTEGPQRAPTSPVIVTATSCNNNLARKTDDYADPAVAVAPDLQGEGSRERVFCSSGESTALLPSGSGPLSPYRSQSSGEAPTSQCTRAPAPVTVYITLDMCDQGQSR